MQAGPASGAPLLLPAPLLLEEELELLLDELELLLELLVFPPLPELPVLPLLLPELPVAPLLELLPPPASPSPLPLDPLVGDGGLPVSPP